MTTTLPPVNLTTEQHAALSAHDRSVSLAAGAGCGKTFVLTERFLSYLDPRVFEPLAELHELVAITFTDAAAREMRLRIRNRCYERLTQAADPDEQQAWRRLLRSLDSARISTIHSFCAALLRSHAAEAELDPLFEQLDQASADLLRLRTLDQRLRQLLLERNEQLIELATRFTLRTLREHLAHLVGQDLGSMIGRWRDAPPDELIAVWKQHFTEVTARAEVNEFLASNAVQRVRNVCQTAQVNAPELRALFDRLLAIFAELDTNSASPSLLTELRELAKAVGPARKKNWADESEYVRFMEASKELRARIDKSILLRPWSEAHLQEAARTGLNLLELAADVSRSYELAKQQRNVLEFDDLMRKAHQLLTEPRFANVQGQLSQSTRLLLVDEFQDTDPLQVAIVQAFCGKTWREQGLFVVGDFKQSIYRFRGAEPKVSAELRESLPERGRLSLTTNFRSQGEILDFVNALFCESFDGKFEPLHPSRAQLTPPPSVEFLWAVENESQDDDTIPPQLKGAERHRYLEARFIARRLSELIDSATPLIVDQQQNTLRPVRQGDIAILLRSLSDVQVYEAALREQGLDYYLAGGHAFYAQQEIHDVLHLLRAVVSVVDDLSLAGALRSPLFSLTDETLFWLVNHGGSLNAGLFAASLPEELTDGERAKVIRAGNVLQQLRSSKDNMLVAELLTRAIELTGYDAVLLTEFLGQRKLANLHKLVEQARTLDRLSPGDLGGFVMQLTEFVTRAPKEPVATTSATGDVIRIMTIHNAKGLEFPLVVLPDLNRKPPPGDQHPVMHRELGPLVPGLEKSESCVGWDLHQLAEKHEEQNEKVRLLYVACTRAADFLILSSSLKDPHKPESDWLKFLGERFDLTSGECLAELPPDYDVPAVSVIMSEPMSTRKPVGRMRGTDLEKLIAKTQALVAAGKGVVPAGVTAIPPQTQFRQRFSFSRLSGALTLETPAATFAAEEVIQSRGDSLQFGMLVHALLQRIPFDGTADARELCHFLAPQYLNSDSPASVETAAMLIERFLESDRFQQIARARCVKRELEFILPWQLPDEEFGGHYLHGFIDCLYQDAQGEWHLVDYKSNQVTAESVPAAALRYEMQMYVYALACERALGKRPVESVVHFLRPECAHTFPWTPERDAELNEELQRAITTLLTPPTIC